MNTSDRQVARKRCVLEEYNKKWLLNLISIYFEECSSRSSNASKYIRTSKLNSKSHLISLKVIKLN